MKRFFGMMPSEFVEIKKKFLDPISGLTITIEAGPKGWTIIYADHSTEYEDIDDSSMNNFTRAYDKAIGNAGLSDFYKESTDNNIGGEETSVSLPYTHVNAATNEKVAELMSDYDKLCSKAKQYGLDIRLYDDGPTLVLYYNDDYPDTILVDKYLSSKTNK